jgi:S-sulfo-L-cysteine synthase (O-acetyl-L-serine-dependent)
MTTIGGTTLPSETLRVGGTPLLEITELHPALGGRVRLFAKAEWHNPGGSVKDRPAARIVLDALRAGKLEGKTLLDATSGNTGVAYAWICARLGIKCSLAVPGSINSQRRAILEAYGAELLFTDPLEGSDGAIREARLIYDAEPGKYYYADQYNNESNWRAHYETTAPEILEQTGGAITHFVAGLGTSGTFVGTGRKLREAKPGIKLLSVEPDSPLHGLEGLKHMDSAIVPGIYDRTLADEKLQISTELAQKTARDAARKLGILIGPSGGANLAAALKIAGRSTEPACVVTVFPDSGERYLVDRFWREG